MAEPPAGAGPRVRYGQCWEDADRLVEALAPLKGRTVLSIASGGENSLALLAEGPARLVVLDHNPAQIALLQLKLAAMAELAHGELMELLGAWPCPARRPDALAVHRLGLYRRCRHRLPAAAAAFWDRQPALVAGGLLRCGRFERYLEGVRRWLLPLVRRPERWRPLLAGLSQEQRVRWYAQQWDGRRWRWLLHLCFSRAALGHLGTDPAQVRYGDGRQGAVLLERLRQVLVELDPRDNPYLHWLLEGHFGTALPRALRPGQVQRIRRHLEQIECQPVGLAQHLAAEPPAGGWIERFNLSNVFEALTPAATTALLGRLHRHAAPGARLVAWNRLAERDAGLAPPGSWRGDPARAACLHSRDRVPFYRRLVLAAALPAPPSPNGAAACAGLRQLEPEPGLWPADEHWQLQEGGRERARAALWWRHTPPLAGERLGAIGALAAADAEAAAVVLAQACRRLAEQGCTRLLAPLDGNTWNPYRCRTGAPLGFAGEPAPGPEWIAHLHRCGFALEARYLSRRITDLAPRRSLTRVRRRLAAVRLVDLAGLPAPGAAGLVGPLHRLVQAGFRYQPWHLPLEEALFARWLEQRQGLADPAATLLALDGDRLVGLLLAHRCGPDLVVRTLVVEPGRAHAGLGALLLEEAHQRARAGGCAGVIHALMHAEASSLALSRHWPAVAVAGTVLMGRRLGPPQPGGAGRP